MTVPIVRIRDVTATRSRQVNPQAHPNELFEHLSIPAFDAGESAVELGATIKSNKLLVQPGQVLFSKLNPRISRVWKVEPRTEHRMVCSTEFVPLAPMPDRLLPDYLVWRLKSPDIPRRLKLGTLAATKSRERVAPAQVLDLTLPLPSLDEQRQIVDLFDRAASLKRLAGQAQTRSGEVIPALFVDMFGDPATNPKGWPKVKMTDLGTLDRGKSRHRPRNDPRLFGGSHPFIQTGDVAAARGLIRSAKQFYSDFGLAQSRLWPAGTLCITIAANIAETGILAFPACFPDSVVGFKPADGVNTRYVQHFIDHLRPYLERTAPQLAQKNINLEILREVRVPLPPKELQEEFAEHLGRVEGFEEMASRSIATAEQTSNALMSRVFGN